MTTTDRPSIAELQRMCARDTFTDEGVIIKAAPVLLEIAAAALELREQERVAARARFECLRRKDAPDSAYAATDVEDRKLKQCRDAYDDALAKVTP